MDEKAASTSAVFTDDLVLPSRRQRFDILLRPRYWFLNVLALRLGLSLGKLLSRLLFPSINPPWNGWWDALLSTYDEAFKITFVCAILLLCAGLVWSYFVPDYSDSDREFYEVATANVKGWRSVRLPGRLRSTPVVVTASGRSRMRWTQGGASCTT